MIVKERAKIKQHIADDLVLDFTYGPTPVSSDGLHNLSPVAQRVFRHLHPKESIQPPSSDNPEIVALRLLDYLSSKKGYIRRKGDTFRTEDFYLKIMPLFLKAINTGRPLVLSTLCLCTTLANKKYAGESPYPHMAAYIAFENLQKIAQASRKIYAPGVHFVLGYEGGLYLPLYFHSEVVVRNSLAIFTELNDTAYRRVAGEGPNPIQVVDAFSMVERAFGDVDLFWSKVDAYQAEVADDSLTHWKDWYAETVSPLYFPSEEARQAFIHDKARWRAALCHFKYAGGFWDKGFVGFDEHIIPFTPAGRRKNMIALQLVPENPFLPHQRVMVHDVRNQRWRMRAYEDLEKEEAPYVPCYVERFSYPFYFEKAEV